MRCEFYLSLEQKSPISWGLAMQNPLGPVKRISVHFVKYKSVQGCTTWTQCQCQQPGCLSAAPKLGATPKTLPHAFQSPLQSHLVIITIPYLSTQTHNVPEKRGSTSWATASEGLLMPGFQNKGIKAKDTQTEWRKVVALWILRLHLQSRMSASLILMRPSNPVPKENALNTLDTCSTFLFPLSEYAWFKS